MRSFFKEKRELAFIRGISTTDPASFDFVPNGNSFFISGRHVVEAAAALAAAG